MKELKLIINITQKGIETKGISKEIAPIEQIGIYSLMEHETTSHEVSKIILHLKIINNSFFKNENKFKGKITYDSKFIYNSLKTLEITKLNFSPEQSLDLCESTIKKEKLSSLEILGIAEILKHVAFQGFKLKLKSHELK